MENDKRNQHAKEIEIQVISMLLAAKADESNEKLAVFDTGEIEWVSTLKREFGEEYQLYAENANMITISWLDYCNNQVSDIIGWIYSVLN